MATYYIQLEVATTTKSLPSITFMPQIQIVCSGIQIYDPEFIDEGSGQLIFIAVLLLIAINCEQENAWIEILK